MIDLDTSVSIEGTSTVKLARELFRSSCIHNDGRTVYDPVFFDSLDDVAKFHLVDVAAAAESLMQQFQDEPEVLLLWNVAEVLYRAYHEHPLSGCPDLPWSTAPKEVKVLWHRYAEDVYREWLTVKHLPKHKPWINVEIKR